MQHHRFALRLVLPLSAEAKLLMASQSLISLATVALVIARAVNIL